MSACACLLLTPGLSRATRINGPASRFVKSGSDRGSDVRRSPVKPKKDPVNSRGATPTMVNPAISLPEILGSPPKRFQHE